MPNSASDVFQDVVQKYLEEVGAAIAAAHTQCIAELCKELDALREAQGILSLNNECPEEQTAWQCNVQRPAAIPDPFPLPGVANSMPAQTSPEEAGQCAAVSHPNETERITAKSSADSLIAPETSPSEVSSSRPAQVLGKSRQDTSKEKRAAQGGNSPTSVCTSSKKSFPSASAGPPEPRLMTLAAPADPIMGPMTSIVSRGHQANPHVSVLPDDRGDQLSQGGLSVTSRRDEASRSFPVQAYALAKHWRQLLARVSFDRQASRDSQESHAKKCTAMMGTVAGGRRHSRVLLKESMQEQFCAEKALHFLESKVIIEPCRTKQVAWEICGSIMLLYDIFALPLVIAFDPEPTSFTESMVWTIRVFWTADVFITFLTGYVDAQGVTVMSLRKVAKNCVRGAFPLDVVVVLFDWLDAIIGVRATGLLKSWRLLRVVRLLRLRKAQKLWERFSELVAAEHIMVLGRTIRNLVNLFALLHFIACAWWGIGTIGLQVGRSWSQDLQRLPLDEKYAHAFHLGISNFYGEHITLPENQLERVFTIIILYSSFMCQIWFVSSTTTAMTHLEIVSSRRSALFLALDCFLLLHKIPLELRLKVHRNARHGIQAQEASAQESSIELLGLLSEPLMMRLHAEMFLPTIRVVPWICCLMKLSGPLMERLCHYAISIQDVSKDDVIFSDSDKPLHPSMRLAVDGSLRYRDVRGARTVGKHQWLSEMSLWTDDWVHKGTLQAESDRAQIVVVDAASLRSIIATSEFGFQISLYADLLLRQHEPTEISDIMEYKVSLDLMLALAFEDAWEDAKDEFKEVMPEGAEVRASSWTTRLGSVVILQ